MDSSHATTNMTIVLDLAEYLHIRHDGSDIWIGFKIELF